MHTRSTTYRKRWKELIEYHGSRCYYCRKEIATTIDHVIPYSWDHDNILNNLVPACSLCNSLANNKIFDNVELKRQYILGQRKKRDNRRAICVICLLPFAYRIHSPSFILCPECYDEEYQTKEAQTKEWKKWVYQLKAAGIPAEAHRNMKARLEGMKRVDREVRLETLIDEYAKVIEADDEFAEMLMVC